jgi:ribosomal protein S1
MNFTQEQWNELRECYPSGTAVTGIVTRCKIFGVFVQLDQLPTVTALLEIIHFDVLNADPDHSIKFPDDYPPVGARVEVRILGWCLLPKDVRLTQLSHLDWFHSRWLREQND